MGSQGERGMVTAELAVGILAVMAMVSGCAWGASLGVQQLHASDLASQLARQFARGDVEAARRLSERAPAADVVVSTRAGLVVVEVRLPGRSVGMLPAVPTSARATAALEPGQ